MLKDMWDIYRTSNLRTNVLFCLILGINVGMLLFACGDLSIHHREAAGVFYSQDLLFVVVRFFLDTFGWNDYVLRLPLILLHIGNMFLMYRISRLYLKKPRDSLIVVLVYALLPGVMLSALLVLKSGFIIFVSLLCCYYQMRFKRMPYVMMFVAVFLDGSFAVLFFALFFYTLRNKNTLGMFITLVFFALNMYIFGFDVSGSPRNYFLQNLGKMALYFSPLLLVYYFYTIVNALKKQNNILVDIGATSMFFVMLLSLRQDVDLESLFPMSVVALPVAIRHFFADMRVRLPNFRAVYVRRFVVIFALLCMQSLVLYGNKVLYLFGVQNHFASSYYISKDVANVLQSRGIESIKVSDSRLELALRFYGIKSEKNPYLLPITDLNESYVDEIDIVYLGKKVASFVVVPTSSGKPLSTTQAHKNKQIDKAKNPKTP
ncbi:putative integral membrane protein [Helicobacter cinaedi PAGU611]|uniref:Integral membrane protein n=2 Tax=Helicobacter cinaedi TaxID=213 RepID=A0AAI8MPW8_9HELI|nr:hypothetical protein [Helicobacter cinaedi]AWK62379.1 hypothetical protein C6B36_08565 [Helicobacter cinaedi]EFR45913.1 hypothetical protein HCCG_00459 [Helicobacter cinaedi CCUG 18818 = ATCC BAA-847]QOQ90824.1 hypothetical protein HW260_00155 [Helicobacter cinaedi]QOQ96983.1 hypothetical protein HW245_04955 [Helicobacter cinaedi]BAM12945.1 putative integral membrane protein [Helicobacter cinaedi PAGU611]